MVLVNWAKRLSRAALKVGNHLSMIKERAGDFWGSNSVLISIALIVAAVVLVPTALVLSGHLQTGFSGKTLWDWINVLAVPVGAALILGLLGVAAQRAGERAEIERELTIERARESALREYLDRVSDLVLDRKLRECEQDSPVRALAQARTLGLDGPRKGILVRFLHDSRLITRGEAIVSLALADLTRSDLSGANLAGADLSRANLTYADLYDADLSGADLYLSVVSGEQLAQAKNTVGARMRDGTTMTGELWEKFRRSRWEFAPPTDKT